MKSIKSGCYPAAVTPMREGGEIDSPGMARLLAWFESQGCTGAVIAGTNGEGPSLAAVEKRDLLREIMPLRGKLDLILGVATNSLTEAIWSCQQAAKLGASASLVMAPSYFREASDSGVETWFLRVLDQAELPVLVYNFPQRTGITLSPDLLGRLANHPNMAGAKDSSGNQENLTAWRKAMPGRALFVGNETLLLSALAQQWSGTISGAANVIPGWLSQVVDLWHRANNEEATLKFDLALRGIEALRGLPQPPTNKSILAYLGILESGEVRLPLQSQAVSEDLLKRLAGLIPTP